VFKNFIEPGRVVYVNFGKDFGKVAVIVDIVDSRRVLIDGPTTGFPRTIYPVKRLGLTSIKVNKILKGARTGTLKKAATEQKLNEKWAATSIAKKIAVRAKRASLTDFDRFKVMISRKNRSFKFRPLAAKINGAGKKAAAPAKKAAPAQKKK
jgi:large subunit ribosomal protein L14e